MKMQTGSFTFSTCFYIVLRMFNICNEIMCCFFCKKKTIGKKYEKCFQLSKANVDLNRSRFSWLTAADN